MSLPSQILIGYLPNSSKSDAEQYAKNVARSYLDVSNSWLNVTNYRGGFTYELHEGGEGLAYMPSILNQFNSLGVADLKLYIATSLRTVEVSQDDHEGLSALVLPGDDRRETSVGIEAAGPMIRVESSAKSWIKFGAIALGISAILGGLGLAANLKVVASEPNPSAPKVPLATALPSEQWEQLKAKAMISDHILALRYSEGKWRIDAADAPSTPAPGAAK